jgi:Uma2 family endonuclease
MSARVILTYDDYAALSDDGHRYELYEGELVTMPSPRPRHQVIIGNLYMLIAELARTYEAAGSISFRGFVERLREEAEGEGTCSGSTGCGARI